MAVRFWLEDPMVETAMHPSDESDRARGSKLFAPTVETDRARG